MCRQLLLFLVVLAALPAALPAVDLAEAVRTRPVVRPSLLVRPDTVAGIVALRQADPVYDQAYAHLRQRAHALQTAPSLKRRLDGRRLLNVARTCLKRVLTAGVVHLVDGDATSLAVCRRAMLEVAAFKDWNPSHFLDVAEMTAALAIGYDWCYDALTDQERETIHRAIVRHGLRPGRKGGWWVEADNNWNQVCHGGLTLGALAVRDREPELAARIIERAVQHLPRAMAVYAPDGAYPEGPGYWKYGTAYNVMLIEALRTVLGSDAGLSRSPGFLASADFYRHARGTSGLIANYADCHRDKGDQLAPTLFWFARATDSPGLLDVAVEQLAAWPGQEHDPASRWERLVPLLFLYAPSEPPPATVTRPTSWVGGGPMPVAFHRGAWDEAATFICFKGGSPGHNHGHMDIGSFILDSKGRRWAEDLGMEDYGRLEAAGLKIWDRQQGSDRWTVFRHHVRSHNTLMIDGQGQQVDGRADFLRHQLTGARRFSLLDMTPVYRDRLARAHRGVALEADGSVLIRDELRPRQAGELRWALCTFAEVELLTGRLARLRVAGEECYWRIDAPASAEWTTFPTEPERRVEKDNAGSRMLGFTAPLTDGGEMIVQVGVHPDRPVEVAAQSALAEW